MRDYTEAEWRSICGAAGLVVEHTETWRKPIPFDDWCRRMRVADDTRAELIRRFVSAPPAAQQSFAIEAGEESIRQFSLHALLLAARRR